MSDIDELKKLAESAIGELADEAMGNGSSPEWAAKQTAAVSMYIERLQRELEDARTDAGRYAQLREADWEDLGVVRLYTGPDVDNLTGEALDRHLDAARQQEG